MDEAPASRDDGLETAILEALLEHPEQGLTVFELRAMVDADIDALESALRSMKAAGTIEIETVGDETRIRPASDAAVDESAVGDSLTERLRRRLPF